MIMCDVIFFLFTFQVFSEARVYFSADGKVYSGDPVIVKPKEDCIFEEPRNITIKLHRKIAQYVKLQLFWAAKWILISEVTFEARKSVCANSKMKICCFRG